MLLPPLLLALAEYDDDGDDDGGDGQCVGVSMGRVFGQENNFLAQAHISTCAIGQRKGTGQNETHSDIDDQT